MALCDVMKEDGLENAIKNVRGENRTRMRAYFDTRLRSSSIDRQRPSGSTSCKNGMR